MTSSINIDRDIDLSKATSAESQGSATANTTSTTDVQQHADGSADASSTHFNTQLNQQESYLNHMHLPQLPPVSPPTSSTKTQAPGVASTTLTTLLSSKGESALSTPIVLGGSPEAISNSSSSTKMNGYEGLFESIYNAPLDKFIDTVASSHSREADKTLVDLMSDSHDEGEEEESKVADEINMNESKTSTMGREGRTREQGNVVRSDHWEEKKDEEKGDDNNTSTAMDQDGGIVVEAKDSFKLPVDTDELQPDRSFSSVHQIDNNVHTLETKCEVMEEKKEAPSQAGEDTVPSKTEKKVEVETEVTIQVKQQEEKSIEKVEEEHISVELQKDKPLEKVGVEQMAVDPQEDKPLVEKAVEELIAVEPQEDKPVQIVELLKREKITNKPQEVVQPVENTDVTPNSKNTSNINYTNTTTNQVVPPLPIVPSFTNTAPTNDSNKSITPPPRVMSFQNNDPTGQMMIMQSQQFAQNAMASQMPISLSQMASPQPQQQQHQQHHQPPSQYAIPPSAFSQPQQILPQSGPSRRAIKLQLFEETKSNKDPRASSSSASRKLFSKILRTGSPSRRSSRDGSMGNEYDDADMKLEAEMNGNGGDRSIYHGDISVSWYEGTTTTDLKKHVRKSMLRKLDLAQYMIIEDIRVIDASIEPNEEIVLSPFIPHGSTFLLKFRIKDTSEKYEQYYKDKAPDSPSAAPSPFPDPRNLGQLQVELGRVISSGSRSKSKRPPSPPLVASKSKAEADPKPPTSEISTILSQDSKQSDSDQDEDLLEERIEEFFRNKLGYEVYRPVEKKQVVFMIANYFVLFLSIIAISAEIHERAPRWIEWVEQNVSSVQNCAADRDALFECISSGDFSGLVASIIIWASQSVGSSPIFLFGFESPSKLWTVVYEALVTAVCWGTSYICIRRGLNPDTRKDFLHKYWKDAVYGSLAGFNAAFMKAVLKNLIPQDHVLDVLETRQLRIVTFLGNMLKHHDA